ncbi:MAG: hypothetical protein K8S55_11150 [Phycisphaerae bacterium]|nr:hypothetical protein [Phycisphaerae bacterium]
MNFRISLFCLSLTWMAGCQSHPPLPTGQPLTVAIQQNAWDNKGRDGQELVSTHYRIYTTVRKQRLLDVLPGFLEAAWANYADFTGLQVTRHEQMPVYMFASRAQWVEFTDGLFGKNAPPSMHIESGGYTYQGVTVCWDIGGLATFTVAAHEGLHQFLYYALRDRLPRWADEGLATTAEGFVLTQIRVRFTPGKNITRIVDLRQIILNDKWMSMKELLTTHTLKALGGGRIKGLGYYGQLYALMLFLRTDEIYRPRWQAMLADAVDGRLKEKRDPVKQFKLYIAKDLDAFEAKYRTFAAKLAQLPTGPTKGK